MTTTEENEIIATFNGWEYNEQPIPGRSFVGWYRPHVNQVKFKGHSMFVGTSDKLRFDKSWDWLMPVVEKIEQIEIDEFKPVGFSIEGTEVEIKDYRRGQANFVYYDGATKLEAVYEATVQFIQWYNENKES